MFDATNTTQARRHMVYEVCTVENSYKTFFVESVCTSAEIIDANIKVFPEFSISAPWAFNLHDAITSNL